MPITLRDVIQEDLPVFFEHQLDPVATEMAAFPSRDREAFMAHWAKIMKNAEVIIQTILFDGQVAGNIVSFEMDGRREVGYWVGREFWGKGIASESLRQFLGDEKRRPLFAHVARNNVASKKVLEKCGFEVISPEDKESEEWILTLE